MILQEKINSSIKMIDLNNKLKNINKLFNENIQFINQETFDKLFTNIDNFETILIKVKNDSIVEKYIQECQNLIVFFQHHILAVETSQYQIKKQVADRLPLIQSISKTISNHIDGIVID